MDDNVKARFRRFAESFADGASVDGHGLTGRDLKAVADLIQDVVPIRQIDFNDWGNVRPIFADPPAQPAPAQPMSDDEIEAELALLSDNEILDICLNTPESTHPSRREELAQGECERRGIDL